MVALDEQFHYKGIQAQGQEALAAAAGMPGKLVFGPVSLAGDPRTGGSGRRMGEEIRRQGGACLR